MAEKSRCSCGADVAPKQMTNHLKGAGHARALADADGRQPGIGTLVPSGLNGHPADAAQPPVRTYADEAAAAAVDPKQAALEAHQREHPEQYRYDAVAAGKDASPQFLPTVKDDLKGADLVTQGRRTVVPPMVEGQADEADPEREGADSYVIADTPEPAERMAREPVIVDALGSKPVNSTGNAQRPTVRAIQEGASVASAARPAAVFVPAASTNGNGTHPTRGVAKPLPATDRVTDEYSITLGGERYESPHVFGDDEDPSNLMKTYEGHRLRFSRSYFDLHVLLDIFERESDDTRRAIAEKSRALAKYKLEHPGQGWGYIPIMLGVTLDYEVAILALRGKIMPLQLRQPYE